MTTRTMGNAPGRSKAKFTVSDAARAFRKARGNAEKIERIEGEKRYVRRDETGRFVIVRPGKPSISKGKTPDTHAPSTGGRVRR